MVRFLHAADLHLDSAQPRGLIPYEGAPVDACRDSTRRALERLVQWAIAEAVDFVLIAGDVYDGDWRDVRTGLFFVDQLRRLRDSGIACYMIRGNHDAASEISRDLPLPANPDGTPMLLSHDRCETVVLASHGVALHGQGFATRSVKENLAVGYPAAIRGMLNIGLLHTCLEGIEGHDPYAPCTNVELRAKDYDYWALGHIHQRNVTIHQPGEPPVLFSGNLQGRHIRETGPKGAYDVRFTDNRCSVTFQPFHVYQWQIVTLDVTACEDEEAVWQHFARQVVLALEPDATQVYAVRVEVVGRTPLHARLHQLGMALTDQLKSVAIDAGRGQIWIEDVRLRTQPPSDRAAESTEGAVEDLMQILCQIQQAPSRVEAFVAPLVELSRRLPASLRADEAFAPEDPQWISVLLEELKPFLASRLR